MSHSHESESFSAFKETLASRIAADSDGLDEFIIYLASLAWDILPIDIHSASYEHPPSSTSDSISLNALPLAFGETLAAYGVLDATDDEASTKLLTAVLDDFIADRTAAPAAGRNTRSGVSECEICTRPDSIINLTYHHLVPRSTHKMVRQRGLHPEERLQAVAWICRPCHNMVHRVATNEELAKDWYTVDKLLERDDIQRWRSWASKQGHRKKR
ncbi:hypothetical protein BKA62DRAFT_15532 [Auriculariales sp. MPI-PUGE-AT-0066]|nr:hypothetical protein BKA62DRAFT_15532 [Auriculariales sp. MPI-PUGE-AT-0066]